MNGPAPRHSLRPHLLRQVDQVGPVVEEGSPSSCLRAILLPFLQPGPGVLVGTPGARGQGLASTWGWPLGPESVLRPLPLGTSYVNATCFLIGTMSLLCPLPGTILLGGDNHVPDALRWHSLSVLQKLMDTPTPPKVPRLPLCSVNQIKWVLFQMPARAFEHGQGIPHAASWAWGSSLGLLPEAEAWATLSPRKPGWDRLSCTPAHSQPGGLLLPLEHSPLEGLGASAGPDNGAQTVPRATACG